MNNEYKLAVALLQFKMAYKQLVDASKAMPDYDISQGYPFYLLDYEVIEPAVLQWCTVHAQRLLRNLPDKIDNPACIDCSDLRVGLAPSGVCAGKEQKCTIFPYIQFSKEAVTPFLTTNGIDLTGLDDTAIHVLYIRKVEEVYEQKRKTETS